MIGLWRFGLVIASLAALVSTAPASSHLTPNSEVTLSLETDFALADIVVPQGEYAFATGNPVRPDPASIRTAREYLARHFEVAAPDGRPWAIDWQTIEFKQIAGPPDLHAVARLVPPPGAPARTFRLHWSVLLDELPSHFALVVLASDRAGKLGEERVVLGALRSGNTALSVDRGSARTTFVFANALLIGGEHILEGYDHLLFLIALLLPAPLVARGGRWCEARPLRDTAYQLLRIVTAFTIGHSLTLIGATLGGWSLPTAPVEAAIALSVLVSAIHAIRPLVPGREHWVAVGFGLIHGLAFATLLDDAGVGQASAMASLLGFNLGIELVQLAIVALVVPALIVLAHTSMFSPLRIGLGVATSVAATIWVINRTTGAGEPLAAAVDHVIARGGWLIAALYVAAASAVWPRKRAAAKGRPLQFQSTPPDQRE